MISRAIINKRRATERVRIYRARPLHKRDDELQQGKDGSAVSAVVISCCPCMLLPDKQEWCKQSKGC